MRHEKGSSPPEVGLSRVVCNFTCPDELPPTPVISLGAGVQSSTLLLMAAQGEFDTVPPLAVFADTGDEPAEVYVWLDFLREQVGHIIEIVTVERGHLGGEILDFAAGRVPRMSNAPFYTRDPETGERGILGRNCTRDFKITPIHQELARRGYGLNRPVEQWMGISADEVARMKPSRKRWITHRYPLVDARITRHDCQLWLQRNGYPPAPRSACVYCPFHRDHEWRRMRDEDPESWEQAVAFDATIRRLPQINNPVFLHDSLVPLDQVDLSTAEDHGQISFDAECEGMCGV